MNRIINIDTRTGGVYALACAVDNMRGEFIEDCVAPIDAPDLIPSGIMFAFTDKVHTSQILNVRG